MLVREPAVAGMFYPDDPELLHKQLDHFLSNANSSSDKEIVIPKALIVPHAGYVYSGPIAASAYQLLAPVAQHLSKVILLGPSHRVPLTGLAAPTSSFFRTPLGDIPIDREGIDKLVKQSLITVDDLPHQFEHSLEVQLPFLQTTLDDFMVLPLVIGRASSHQVAEVLRTVWGGNETLIIVSSDLSHYHSYLEARRIDQNTTAMIESFADNINDKQACGHKGINGLLKLTCEKGMSIKTLDLRNSGDSVEAPGVDKNKVVGYGAYVVY